MKRETIAVFDFDGTITQKDTLLEFIKSSKGKWQCYFGFLLFSPLLVAMKLNLYPNWKAKQQLYSFYYKGISIEKFNYWGNKFSVEIDKIVRPKALEAFKLHKKNGDKIVIVSASIENWIKHWATKEGVDVVLATQIEISKNELLTGKFFSKNCYGHEKVARFLKMFPNRNNYKLIVYGDSPGDKELMEIADKSYYNKFK